MKTSKENSDHPEGPEAKCCLGVTYFNRALESKGAVPKCMGLAQMKRGEHDNDDVRMLSDATADFKYYCIGYSSHPTGTKPSRPGQPTQMPYCEGIEVAITEERVPAQVPAAGAAAGQQVMRDQSDATLEHGGAAPLPPMSTDPSDSEDRSIQTRFRKQLHRNVDVLRSALTGEKLPQLPVQLRKYDNVAEAKQTFVDTASLNLLKMRVMAEFISHRTLNAAKPIWERFRSEEETE